jgi:hypothetical protein
MPFTVEPHDIADTAVFHLDDIGAGSPVLQRGRHRRVRCD